MNIGGFQPFSLSDYPGKISALIFTQGCNFRCPFCHNGSLISVKDIGKIKEEEIFFFLKEREHWLDGVVVTGGEPTIHKDLPDFLRSIREIGLLIKLDTNGSRPDVLRFLFEEGLVDYVAMDIKAPMSIYNKLAGVTVPLKRVEESISLIVDSGIEHEFRTTEVKSLLSPEDIIEIKKNVPKGSKYCLQEFRPENALEENIL